MVFKEIIDKDLQTNFKELIFRSTCIDRGITNTNSITVILCCIIILTLKHLV